MPPALASVPGGAPSAARSWISDLRETAGDIWQYRELLYQLTRRDVRLRYKQTAMGLGWALFMPGFVVLAGVLVRLAMARLSGGGLPAASVAGLAVKALPWAFFVGAIGFAVNSLTGNPTLVAKIYFPREVLPLSSVLAQAFDSVIGAVLVAVLLPFLGIGFGLSALWVPLLAVLLFLFTTAAALFLGCANLFFRDVKYIVQVMLTFGIFVTPVFFEPAMFGPLGAKLIMLNPLAPILEGLRLAVVEGHNLLEPLTVVGRQGQAVIAWEPWYLSYAAAWAVAGAAGAVVLFHRLAFVFAEYL